MRYHVSIIHETGHLREYDVFPGSLLSLPAEIAMPWTDTTTPRTDAPVRFAWHFDAHNGGKVQAWTEPYSWEV